jgi:hypothetical protein
MIITPLGTYLNPSATGLPPFFNIQPVSQSVNPASATFGVQPANQYETVGDTATFFVESGSPDGGTLSYQWQYATSPYTVWNNVSSGTGGTTDTYTTPTLIIGDNLKQYRCQVTNTKSGLTVSFTSEATDPEAGAITYQWFTSSGSSSALPATANATISSSSTGMTGSNPATGSFYCRATDIIPLSTNSNTVSATIYTTSLSNSNAATLYVNAASAAPTVWETPVSESGTLVYLSQTASDTSMEPQDADYNTNTSGYGEFTWGNIPVSTATIYFDYAFNVGSNQYGTIPPTTQTAIIQMSFDGGSTFTTPYDYVNNRLLRGRSNQSSIASTPFSIECPNTVTNLNQVKVRVGFSCGILQLDITEWDAFAQAVAENISASYT